MLRTSGSSILASSQQQATVHACKTRSMASQSTEQPDKLCCIVKRIKFFGRSVKIVMQNENGPCPLLAIANVLSLRNELKLPAGVRDITQSELITAIVELLLERSKHFEAAYAADYQQNISEIFPVLQKLTTGVDVNVKFHNLHAFEPTPEVAVFDLLGIPLVHGWLVDPQDSKTTAVFGNKSYNELVELLFMVLGDEEMEALSTGPLRNLSISSHHMHSFSNIGSPSAATARTPSINATAPGSRSHSFVARGASATQNAELQKALHALSIREAGDEQQRQQQAQVQAQQTRELVGGEAGPSAPGAPTPQQQQQQQSQTQHQPAASSSIQQQQEQEQGADAETVIEALMEDMMQEVCSNNMPGPIELGDSPTHNVLVTRRLAYEGSGASRLNPSSGGSATTAATAAAVAGGSGQSAAQEAAGSTQAAAAAAVAKPSQQQGQAEADGPKATAADAAVVRRFMETHCSQLTPYGLSCMVDALKEHQLAVFFRNNHFNALFKYEGAVYLLVTDQGYEYEPDIVWERLDSVQGDTTFCTSEFTPFVPHRAPETAADGVSYSNVVAGGSAATGAGGNMAALTDLDAAIAASLAVEDQHSQPDHAVAAAAADHEDADFALALQLQLQEEEAMAQARAQAQQQQQQQQGAQGQGQQQYRQQQGSRVAAVRQQEQQQQQAQPLESLRQMGQRFASGIQQQYTAATNALMDQQPPPQQQQGRRRTSSTASGRKGSAQDEKCSIM